MENWLRKTVLVVKKVGKFVGSKFCFHRIIGKERL